MRVFEQGNKINFVDINDVYVGLDAYQSCCESFGYYFAASAERGADDIGAPVNLESLIFDVVFFAEHEGDYNQAAVFKLIQPNRLQSDRTMRDRARALAADGGCSEVFLVIFNHHNGYYGHGFEMTHGGTVVQSGCL